MGQNVIQTGFRKSLEESSQCRIVRSFSKRCFSIIQQLSGSLEIFQQHVLSAAFFIRYAIAVERHYQCIHTFLRGFLEYLKLLQVIS